MEGGEQSNDCSLFPTAFDFLILIGKIKNVTISGVVWTCWK